MLARSSASALERHAIARRLRNHRLANDCDAKHDLAADGRPNDLTRVQRVGAAQVVQSPLAIVNCPSRRPTLVYPLTANQGGIVGFYNSITPNVAGRSDYAANAGDVYCAWPQVTLGRGPKSYSDAQLWTANQSWGSEQPRLLYATLARVDTMTGISYERSSVRISNVVDGLSNTYLAAERYVPRTDYDTGLTIGDNETWCTGFNNDNYRKTGRLQDGEINECTPIPDWKVDVAEPDDRFGSAHPNGWNASFCDGSVRTMSFDIDWRVHRDLGNRMDGSVVRPTD